MEYTEIDRFEPAHAFFIGIDSDGTVFDTMKLKHDGAMIPAAIEIWALQPIGEAFARAAEYINLYSRHRGVNRFLGLCMTFDRLADDPAVRAAGCLPDYAPLREFVEKSQVLSGRALARFRRGKDSPFLRQLAQWSARSDERFARLAAGVGPFAPVGDTLRRAGRFADLMVVSSAAGAGLRADWERAGLLPWVSLAAGQEAGTKTRQLAATAGRYPAGHRLMVGDALGDREAARKNEALFYPILPGREAESWLRLKDEALERFRDGTYAGAYEEERMKEFFAVLGG